MIGPRQSWKSSSGASLFVVLGVLLLVWIFAVPPSGGPDEPSHMVRAGALIRGELEGDDVPGQVLPAYELPGEIGFPDPGCFVFPAEPASCANDLPIPEGDFYLFTKSDDYPVWGHLPAGFGTLVPGSANRWATRTTDAIIPLLLLGAALLAASRRGPLAGASTLLAVTPLAWFTFAVVNPSGPVIAGGLGLWTALVALAEPSSPVPSSGREAKRSGRGHRLTPWLAALSWAAMVLPRRDGLVYGCLILASAFLILDLDVRSAARRLGRPALAVAAVATAATLAWASRSDTVGSLALFAAPLAPVAALGLRRIAGTRFMAGRRRQAIGAAVAVVVAVLGSLVVMSRRSGGFDRAVLRDVIGQTGLNLNEAIGVLGWDDTPIPTSAVYLWLVVLGMLAGAALVLGSRRLLLGAAGIVGVAVLTSWTLTMVQNSTPLYWQGRYYLPLLVGVPILLGTIRVDAATGRRLAYVVAGSSMLVVNLALAQTMRRFGVGNAGSLSPTDWNTYDTPVPPVVLLVVHVVFSAALVVWIMRRGSVEQTPRPGVNVVGYHHIASGLGEIARELHRSLVAAGVPCTTVDIATSDSPQHRAPRSVPHTLYDTTIVVGAALQTPTIVNDLPQVVAGGQRLIGYWFWELGTVPHDHRQAIDLVDEIWTPTEFVRSAYAAAVDESQTPVRLLPTSIPQPSVVDSDVERWRRELTGGPGDTLFVVSFDLFSVVERKNPFGAIDAFKQAFDDGRRNVRLVIKTMNGDQRPDDLQWIRDEVAGDTRITIVDRFVSDGELDALIAAADVYVSLHRSEGLGLHLATAMWLGTPVIATGWSGNLDLMDADSAALVDARLVPVTNGRGAYPDNATWADPDIDQAAEWMRRLATEHILRAEIVEAARERMRSQPDPDEIGAAMWAAIDGDRSGSRNGTVTA
ncbi:DUF2142 domain-containing protein [Ilumatobacter coccineus]|nr:DUF2142 domain-containing protein [Ilumatobacter coccineus]